jgi:hypothetical protein
VINEVMYDPSCPGDYCEYLELYGQGNISGWQLDEGISFVFSDNVTLDGYAIVANNPERFFEYYGINTSFDFSGSLSNSGKTIILRDASGDIKDIVNYYDGQAEENHSLERIDSNGHMGDSTNWKQSLTGGSPGKENGVSLSSGCDWNLSLIMNGSVSSDPTWRYRAEKKKGEKANFTILHWISNSKGDTIHSYEPRQVEATTSYTHSWYSRNLIPGEGYFLQGEIVNLSCEDNNLNDNSFSQLIFVPSPENERKNESNITIVKSPPTAQFGDVIPVDVLVYRGDSSKYAVYASVKTTGGTARSDTSTFHAKEKYTSYTVRLPIVLKPNCKESYDEGEHTIVVEGMDRHVEAEIDLSGTVSSACQEVEKENSGRGKLSYEIIEMPGSVTLGEPFDVELLIENEDEDEERVEVWSYVYRGSKKYSGGEKENLKYVTIDDGDNKKVVLSNTVLEGEEGDYKFKVKLLKNGRVTTIDKTRDIRLYVPQPEEAEDDVSLKSDRVALGAPSAQTEVIRTREIAYESSTFRIKHLIPYFLVFLFVLAVIFALVKT